MIYRFPQLKPRKTPIQPHAQLKSLNHPIDARVYLNPPTPCKQTWSMSDHQLRPPRFLLDDQIVNKARQGERDLLADRVHPLSLPAEDLLIKSTCSTSVSSTFSILIFGGCENVFFSCSVFGNFQCGMRLTQSLWYTLVGFCGITILLRFWIRLRNDRRIHSDDYFILTAWVLHLRKLTN